MIDPDLGSLYQDLIVDHTRRPQARGLLESPTASSRKESPTCGDEVTVSVLIEGDEVVGFGWMGHGCAISQAAASMIATLVIGMPVAEVRALVGEFRATLASRGDLHLDEDRFGDAIALNGVSRYPSRIRCATLAWSALEQALSHPPAP